MSNNYTQDFIDEVKGCRTPSVSGEGGVDLVVREALDEHTANDSVHYSDQKVIEATSDIFSNPNLLINSDFKINQRGMTEWSTGNTTNVYTVDGWYSKRSNITTNGEGLSVAWDGVNATEGCIQQKIETTALFGRTVTFSFCVDGETFAATDAMPAVADTSKYVTLSENIVAVFTNHAGESASVVILYKSATPVTIEWAKLELGSIATPFIPPDPTIERARCQRYLLSLLQSSTYRAAAVATDYIDFSIPTPTTMRPISGMSIINPENFDVRSINPTVSQEGFSYAVVVYGGNQLRLRATKAAHGLTDATLAVLSGKSVLLSAEL